MPQFPTLALLGFSLLAPLTAQEKTVVSLHDFVSQEVRQQGFTLGRAEKVHLRVTGGGAGDRAPYAYGWILNASTREVVWQMDYANAKREGRYRVADLTLDLPKGSYEAYFANHGYGQRHLFAHWTRNIDRRNLNELRDGEDRGRLLGLLGVVHGGLGHWREEAGVYGLDVRVPASAEVHTFEAPLRWKHGVTSLVPTSDGAELSQAFRVQKPVTMHVYAQGESTGHRMVDTAWILDAKTRQRVWEMDAAKAQYAGGAQKNRRQVETLTLPPGEYVATYVTDDSHSPADWNAAPPCDPLLYGLTLSCVREADAAHVKRHDPLAPGPVLAELVRVKDDQDLRATFTLGAARSVRVYAIGEADDDEMVDYAWIEDGAGRRVWTMERPRTLAAGGASKNRLADEVVALPKGTYTLRYRTDGSHAYGDWNADAPRDKDRYGVTLFGVEKG